MKLILKSQISLMIVKNLTLRLIQKINKMLENKKMI